jgi:hypothetical protein
MDKQNSKGIKYTKSNKFKDVSSYPHGGQLASSSKVNNSTAAQRRDSPPKRIPGARSQQQKQKTPDEWINILGNKLIEDPDADDPMNPSKNSTIPNGNPMTTGGNVKLPSQSSIQNRRQPKKGCCCIV